MCPNFFWQNVLKGKNIPAIHFIGKPRAKPFIFPLISITLKSQAKRVIHMAGRSFILGSLSTPGWDQSLIHWAGSSRMMRICPENGSTPMVKSIYQWIASIENWQEPRTHHEISWIGLTIIASSNWSKSHCMKFPWIFHGLMQLDFPLNQSME